MVNGPDQVYIERNGKIYPTRVSFIDEAHLRHVTGRIVAEVGRHIDESSPMVDARLLDGSRVNAIYPPLAVGGPFLTIRKFATDPYTLDDLVGFGTLTPRVAEFLKACVEGRANILVSGGASTGKTTLLNVLSSFIPSDERIITIEDAKELQLRQRHVVCLESRPPNTEGKGEVTIRDLLRNALRMRPDRILIGECRSGEALDMLQAMNTGHEGSLTTVHANSPRDALSRVETMTLMAGFDLPVRAVREQVSSALDVIVHLARLKDGSRRVTQVTEVGHMESEMILLQDVFVFDYRMGTDSMGRSLGQIKATGLRPHLTERLADKGVKVDPALFDPEIDQRPSAGRHGLTDQVVWPR
jgi:pilus assembly protein CpaF